MSHVLAVNGPVKMARGLWGGTGSWLGVIFCLIVLVCQSFHLSNLRRELSEIQKRKEDIRVEVRRHSNIEERSCPRQKRDLPGKRKKRHNGKQVLLHLVPVTFSSNELTEFTGVSWKAALHRGKAFELKNENVKIKFAGFYYIYSQVLYTDIRFVMGQLVTRRADSDPGIGEILLRCLQSMPSNKTLAYNTCYSAGEIPRLYCTYQSYTGHKSTSDTFHVMECSSWRRKILSAFTSPDTMPAWIPMARPPSLVWSDCRGFHSLILFSWTVPFKIK
ncbi:tumor necrosis factor ligand superfamily member 13 isoform X2 [Pelobates fuscus]|uniref:tumor necrosis factor ligand superfamily member 13 isoform X2 n=1 Tax=Pelobates fuscus TaxID=191477 RepID=UPI002FE4B0B4